MALGPTPLNSIPGGLLDFFQIKNGGQYPQHLVPVLAPTLELMDWYVNAKKIPIAATGNAGTGGSFGAGMSNFVGLAGGGLPAPSITWEVPQDEVWVVDQFTVGMNFNNIGGEQGAVEPCVLYPVAGAYTLFPLAVQGGGEEASNAGYTAKNWRTISRSPLLVPPGARLAGFCSKYWVTATSIAWSARLCLIRVRV